MTTFRIGEVAILQNCDNPKHNGMEVTVTSPLKDLCGINAYGEPTSGKGYRIECGHSPFNAALAHQLRKKQPPRSAKAIMRAAILKAKQPQMVPA